MGDIHGHFSAWTPPCWSSASTPSGDRLFSVGDLVDRSPESPTALEWLAGDDGSKASADGSTRCAAITRRRRSPGAEMRSSAPSTRAGSMADGTSARPCPSTATEPGRSSSCPSASGLRLSAAGRDPARGPAPSRDELKRRLGRRREPRRGQSLRSRATAMPALSQWRALRSQQPVDLPSAGAGHHVRLQFLAPFLVGGKCG